MIAVAFCCGVLFGAAGAWIILGALLKPVVLELEAAAVTARRVAQRSGESEDDFASRRHYAASLHAELDKIR